MKLVKYNAYSVSTMGTAGLVLKYQCIKEYAHIATFPAAYG